MQRVVHVDAYRQRRDGDVVKIFEHTRGGPAHQPVARQGLKPPLPRAWIGQSNQSFRERISELERSGEHPDHGYGQASKGSTALGRYQILQSGLVDAGWKVKETGQWTDRARVAGVNSDADFLANPAAQEAAMTEYMRAVERQLTAKGARWHLGETYVGPDGLPVRVTEAGLAGAGHREGAGLTNNTLVKLERKANGKRVNFTPGEKRAIRRLRALSDKKYEFGNW